MSKKEKSDVRALQTFDRESLKSDYAGLFWVAVQTRKREDDFTMSDLARATGKDKGQISNWFSGDPPNWEEHTLADLARGLDIEIIVKARDRKNPMRIFTPFGVEQSADSCLEFSSNVSTPLDRKTFEAEIYRISALS
jgi:transcriptional regulator with XRE-family HTH domain